MGILYQAADPIYWVIWLFVLFALMAFNELGRVKLWCGLVLFALVPIALTLFVWPETAAPGNEYGTGTWFNWVKTYSALAGCLGFIALRFVKWRGADGKTHYLYEKRWALCFPPLILAINIAEAVARDFQVFSFALWEGGVVENLWTISGPWNIMNGIAGILNILTICGWFGIIISKDPARDMIWPDMIWAWVIAYDLWNFAYTYNCISDPCAVDHVRDDGAPVRRRAGAHPDHPQPHGVLRGERPGAGGQRGAGHLPARAHPQAAPEPA